MAREDIIGYVNHEIIRLDAGSGAPTAYVFNEMTDTFLVDNLDTVNGGFVKFDDTADTGSTSLYIPPSQARAFDLRVGSVSILGSGGTTPEFQVINLNSNTSTG